MIVALKSDGAVRHSISNVKAPLKQSCEPWNREAVRDTCFCLRSLVPPIKPPLFNKPTHTIFYKPET
ncbi:hypothetical protein E2C01_047025 [Portunus trituberculatus]|uniref:Uncharacterized protein n=1 Tax=Portunus trituberculatus TaxID=210409 RepID=A0A5B7FZB3_PORTR|nr:hypothetical protein [Portunus trituberculatus]